MQFHPGSPPVMHLGFKTQQPPTRQLVFPAGSKQGIQAAEEEQ